MIDNYDCFFPLPSTVFCGKSERLLSDFLAVSMTTLAFRVCYYRNKYINASVMIGTFPVFSIVREKSLSVICK